MLFRSTELYRVKKNWEKDYLTIFLNAEEETDINDISYIDIYLMVIRQVEATLRNLRIFFDRQLLNSVEDWFKQITKETEQSVSLSLDAEAEGSLGAEAPFLAKLLLKFKGVFKNSSSQKITVREILTKEVTRVKGDINLLLSDGFKKLRKKYPEYKGFLIIIDNLDKCPPEVSKSLFFEYAEQLKALHCTIIYTVPISVLYSWQGLSNTFDDPHILPMINIYQLDREVYPLEYLPQGLNAVAEILEKRVNIDRIFASRDQLLEVVKASGGHIRQLMQLMQRACLTASGRGHTKIKAEDVDYASKQLQFSLERILQRRHFEELAYVAINKEFSDDGEDIRVQLLFNTTVLEYNGSDRWNYPNPLLMRSHAFKRAIATRQSS